MGVLQITDPANTATRVLRPVQTLPYDQEENSMRKKIISIMANISLSLASITIFLLFLEFVVFRLFLLPPDMPTPVFLDGIIKYRPDQEGVYRVRDEIVARFSINSNGWNSNHKDYHIVKDIDKFRIAIIGDSYVSAFQVDYDESMAEQLESRLGKVRSQVYRFGIDGAPLSQYLHILRNEVLQYKPDLVVINVIHNDFDESYEFQRGVYTSSFMKLELENDKVVAELDPTPYIKPWYNWIRESAIWRYLAYRQQIRFKVVRNIILGEKTDREHYQANIDVSMIDHKERNNRIITDYLFGNMKNICDDNDIDLLILIDGDRGNIYRNNKTQDSDILRINRMAAFVAGKYGISFLDLHGVFQEDYSRNHKPFNFKNDGHWNAYAHGLVADALAKHIISKVQPGIPSPNTSPLVTPAREESRTTGFAFQR